MAVGAGMFATVVDQSGVIIAVPKIADRFALDIPTAQWINLIFILSTSALIMPLGRLSDILGGKRVYMGSIFIFVVGAIASGTAVAFPVLLVTRAFQGIGVAGVSATSMAIMTSVFPERERGKAMGLFILLVGAGLSAGPVVGGVLVSEFGWRSVFFASVPFGLIALLSTQSVLDVGQVSSATKPGRFKFDWAGAGLSSGALVSFLLGMTNGHRFGWDSIVIISSFAASIVLMTVFVWWQLRAREPMLDLSLFRSRLFSMGISARLMLFLGGSAVFFLMPFYLIEVLGYEARVAGLLTVPSAVGMGVMGITAGRLSDTLGTRWLSVTGLLVMAAGMFILAQLDVDSSAGYVVLGMALTGAGEGLFTSPNFSALMGSQSRERYGIVSAFLHLTRNGGSAIGVALATTIVTVTMSSLGFEPSLSAAAEVEGEGVRLAFISGLNKAYLVGGGLMLLATVMAILHGEGRRSEPASQRPERVHHSPISVAEKK